MKFEHVLQIYWTKGFFFAGKLFYFDQTLPSLIPQLPGLGWQFKKQLIRRFELTNLTRTISEKDVLLGDYQIQNNTPIFRPLNIIFSQVNSVNNYYTDLRRFILVREYLIKSYRGRCHAIGKPVRGQRTWSNSWNSYNINKDLRFFISKARAQLNKNKVEEKINYKLTKKKYITKKKGVKVKVLKNKTWY